MSVSPRWPSVLASLVLLSGCGGPGDTAFDAVREFAGDADRVSPYASWEELESFATSGEGGVALVVASVVEVTEGAAFRWQVDTYRGEQREQLPYDSEEATVRTVHLVVEVAEVFGRSGLDVGRGQQVTVGLAVNEEADTDDVVDSLEDLPPSLFFLHRSAVYDYEDGLLGVLQDGLLVAVPDGDGELSFPALPFDAPLQPPDGTTLDSLTGLS